MGSGCCTTTKIADASLTIVETQNEAATAIPYGYALIYPGVLTPSQTYTCPMLSIHTYNQSANKTSIDYAAAQFSNKKKYDRKLGSLATSKEEKLSSDETVTMIPVDDVINIYYTTDVKKSVRAQEQSHLVPVASQEGCCSCSSDTTPKPTRQTEIVEEKNAQRVVTIHLQYSKYSNLDTVSNARLLPEADRTEFYKSHFRPKTELKFYLVRNTEYDSANFDKKKIEAENLCRIILQLKGINGGRNVANPRPPATGNMAPPAITVSYPSPQELQQIVDQPYCSVFGDLHQERLHSIQTQQDFGTHVPAPITKTVLPAISLRTTDRITAEDD